MHLTKTSCRRIIPTYSLIRQKPAKAGKKSRNPASSRETQDTESLLCPMGPLVQLGPIVQFSWDLLVYKRLEQREHRGEMGQKLLSIHIWKAGESSYFRRKTLQMFHSFLAFRPLSNRSNGANIGNATGCKALALNHFKKLTQSVMELLQSGRRQNNYGTVGTRHL